jgi:hypothetical protein
MPSTACEHSARHAPVSYLLHTTSSRAARGSAPGPFSAASVTGMNTAPSERPTRPPPSPSASSSSGGPGPEPALPTALASAEVEAQRGSACRRGRWLTARRSSVPPLLRPSPSPSLATSASLLALDACTLSLLLSGCPSLLSDAPEAPSALRLLSDELPRPLLSLMSLSPPFLAVCSQLASETLSGCSPLTSAHRRRLKSLRAANGVPSDATAEGEQKPWPMLWLAASGESRCVSAASQAVEADVCRERRIPRLQLRAAAGEG